MTENEILNELIANGAPVVFSNQIPSPPSLFAPLRTDMDLCQWQVGANGVFRPAAKTIGRIPAGAYTVDADEFGPFLRNQSMISDEIVRLPDTATARVLEGIRKFWLSRDRYDRHGLVYKRGVLLWGPPGSGKTICVRLISLELISAGGIVLFCGNTTITMRLLKEIRRIEPDRPLILVLEDVDEIISAHGEHEILAILDGEHQTSNVTFLATTNYPDRLGARIVNRPSRFDDRVYVGMPSLAARRIYLAKSVGHEVGVDVDKWAVDTEGLSIAHLRELVAGVLCLDQEYGDVLARLRTMNERPKERDGFAKRSVGFEKGQAG